ncbi:MAG: transposase [Spirochaetales bacterium]|nr:transposase [Spirochaetales bacterium]MBO7349580.1 transposase [Spirochaetales bacterium]
MGTIVDYTMLLKKPRAGEIEEKIGRASNRNIDKTGVFYHVITKSQNGDNIFLAKGAGEYRHNLLCRLCEERGITILFSVTMPNHTHDVLLSYDWETISEVYKILNTNTSKFIRAANPGKYPKGLKIIRRHPAYIVIRDVIYLFVLGKYIFDNPEYLRKDGRFVPYDCFWMFRTEHFNNAYDERIYKALFSLSAKELYNIYESMDMKAVRQYAMAHLSHWTKTMTQSIFFKQPEPKITAISPHT